MEKWTSGTGQEMMVHDKATCRGPHCSIHNPSDHAMKSFPTHYRYERGIMERICPHGIGHPDPDDPKMVDPYERVHGCDGCCSESVKETI